MSTTVNVTDFQPAIVGESKMNWFQVSHLIAPCILRWDFYHYIGVVEKGLSNPAVVLASRWSGEVFCNYFPGLEEVADADQFQVDDLIKSEVTPAHAS